MPLPSPAPPRRYALVTGAESGIGRAVALALARDGFDVGITWYASATEAERTAVQVRALGVRAVTGHLDLTDLDHVGDALDALADALGGLDVFVNNAGSGTGGAFLEMPLADWRRTVATNLDGAFVCLQRAARRMVRQGRGGRLIAVTSVHEHVGGPGTGPYAASKHGLGGLVAAIGRELAGAGITATCVAPGEIATSMNGMADTDPRRARRPGLPLGRPGHADEVADVVALLASPRTGRVTGTSWAVDGGLLLVGTRAASRREA